MNFSAMILNVALFGFTILIVLTEGLPKDLIYFLFTLFLFFVPVLNLFLLYLGILQKGLFSFRLKSRVPENSAVPEEKVVLREKHISGKIISSVAVLGNISLIILSCLALVHHFPFPKEGIVAFVVLLLLTPVVSSLVILANGSTIINDGMN